MRSIKTAFSAFLLLTFLSFSASAAVFTVTKTADTNDGTCDADCSLREAVAAANAAAGDDIIVFSSLFDTPQTIVLSGSEIVLGSNGSTTITGPGANLLTIDGNQTSRIFSTGANVVASIDGIRFTRGNGAGAVNTGRGGAIYNVGGTLTISNSIITGNTAGNGGGLNNAASSSPSVPANLTLINCVISNNTTSSSGGALQNFSTSFTTMLNTTVSGNTSNGTGIAGAFQANGTVRITNSTFSGNSAPSGTGGGVYYNGTTSLTMTNSTLVNNSSLNGAGGLHRTGTTAAANVRNTIIANNNGNAANPDAFGLINSQGNNIVGNVLGSSGWIASDLQDTNPLLGPLADNGGLGQTHLPQPGSPAIDAGQNCVRDLSCKAGNPPAAVTEDQRGVSRTTNGNVDIGSVEVAAVAPVSVSGQVLVAEGVALPLALVSITDGNETRYFLTNSFGYFNFEGLSAGTEYTITVSSKAANYPPLLVTPTDDIDGIIFLPSDMIRTERK